MKLLVLFLLGSSLVQGSPVITIDPEDGVTWKSIFDAGFRPKHQPRLERSNTLWFGPSFGARVDEAGAVFRLGPGRLLIEVQTDVTVRMIWHQSDEKITIDEGERRTAAFREVFEPYIIQEMTMPRPVDPSGIVDASNNENNIKARMGELVISYGFDSSFDGAKPLVPHFYIIRSFPGQNRPRVATMEDRVEPPEGYEWYSLDPDVDTPDPGAKKAAAFESDESAGATVASRQARSSEDAELEDGSPGRSSWLWLMIPVALLGLVLGVWRMQARGKFQAP